MELPIEDLQPAAERSAGLIAQSNGAAADQVRSAVADGMKRLLWPSIERLAWTELKVRLLPQLSWREVRVL
ncbi:hypothetical protein CYMTET_56581 [Cymbomonas tetramitiformis]|uniref:Uncharacterized protein n=1 Tax=Cymbomonas tetramitiformis TaxID=36881 RepID=A0AAE0BAK9_9CHLO|nr:hypothetical protein CYMTET_56581 [Cymbomonas tetramitiformis]